MTKEEERNQNKTNAQITCQNCKHKQIGHVTLFTHDVTQTVTYF